MESYQVEDEDHWFTQEHINLFHEKLSKLTRNKNIAREAGRHIALFDSLGMMKSYALGFVGPTWLSDLVGKGIAHFAKSCVWETVKVGPSEVHITVTPKPGVREKPFQCENRMGSLEAIFTLFNREPPVIEHTECMFKGAGACRYRITWRKSQSDIWRKIKNCLVFHSSPSPSAGSFSPSLNRRGSVLCSAFSSQSLSCRTKSGPWRRGSWLPPCPT